MDADGGARDVAMSPPRADGTSRFSVSRSAPPRASWSPPVATRAASKARYSAGPRSRPAASSSCAASCVRTLARRNAWWRACSRHPRCSVPHGLAVALARSAAPGGGVACTVTCSVVLAVLHQGVGQDHDLADRPGHEADPDVVVALEFVDDSRQPRANGSATSRTRRATSDERPGNLVLSGKELGV